MSRAPRSEPSRAQEVAVVLIAEDGPTRNHMQPAAARFAADPICRARIFDQTADFYRRLGF